MKIKKWGNSAGLPLSKPLLEQLDTTIGDTVAVEVKNGALVIRPVREAPTLKALLAGSPREKLEPTEEDRNWMRGAAEGKELL